MKASVMARYLRCTRSLCKAVPFQCMAGAMNDDIPNGWRRSDDGKAIERTLKFADFKTAFAFLTDLAEHAESVDHHPEFTSVWNRLDIRLTSHDSGGVTDRDVEMAQWIDEKFNPSGVQQ
jgi:4a-hydroxytetrahydrobiopterin dehydratase